MKTEELDRLTKAFDEVAKGMDTIYDVQHETDSIEAHINLGNMVMELDSWLTKLSKFIVDHQVKEDTGEGGAA